MTLTSAGHERHDDASALTGGGPGTLRLATWNVNSVRARLPRLLEWLARVRPDVVCLQETKVAQAGFPHPGLEALGYAAATHGDGRWNGVAILSRVGLSELSRRFAREPGFPAPEPRTLRTLRRRLGSHGARRRHPRQPRRKLNALAALLSRGGCRRAGRLR